MVRLVGVLLGASLLLGSCAISTEEARETASGNSGEGDGGQAEGNDGGSNDGDADSGSQASTGSPSVTDESNATGSNGTAVGPDLRAALSADVIEEEPAEPRPTPAAAPNGRRAPLPAATAAEVVEQIVTAERGLRDPDATAGELADFGHLQQVAYRILGRNDDWDTEVFASLPADVTRSAELHLAARRGLRGLSSGYDAAEIIPAWEIIEPEPPASLLAHYAEAQALTRIDWEYLAAINLIETGMGRIRGLSSAGAQGPMQFIPTTWDEVGEGDVNDPHDAIIAAARYLVRRGGPDDMESALWGYNNSDHYVEVVSTYAQLLREDPGAFTGIYNWEIWFWTAEGDVWLPVGIRNDEVVPLDEFLFAAPWAQPGK